MAFRLLTLYVAVLLIRPQEWYEPIQGYELVNIFAILTILATITTQPADESIVKTLTRTWPARLMWGLFAAVLLSQLTKAHVGVTLDAFTDFGKIVIFFFLTQILVDDP